MGVGAARILSGRSRPGSCVTGKGGKGGDAMGGVGSSRILGGHSRLVSRVVGTMGGGVGADAMGRGVGAGDAMGGGVGGVGAVDGGVWGCGAVGGGGGGCGAVGGGGGCGVRRHVRKKEARLEEEGVAACKRRWGKGAAGVGLVRVKGLFIYMCLRLM
jgi:hypothetical protein